MFFLLHNLWMGICFDANLKSGEYTIITFLKYVFCGTCVTINS
jgi:hypothetical protein